MKRSLALAITVLALTAVVEPLFAAESETAAPVGRGLPLHRHGGPSLPRAAAAPSGRRLGGRRRRVRQSQTSSYTGTQAGGFGGGNAGGGGFADPGSALALRTGLSSPA